MIPFSVPEGKGMEVASDYAEKRDKLHSYCFLSLLGASWVPGTVVGSVNVTIAG